MDTRNKNFELGIIIPCYNESNRLKIEDFTQFLEHHKQVFLCFVNDGSLDNTAAIIEQFNVSFNENSTLLSLEKNQGKAEAVRQGVLFANKNYSLQKIAYLDADLATSIEECYQISKQIKEETVFAFGSRISKIDNTIDRKKYRFFIGRFIATLISMQLGLSVYDTQCGCKVFKTEIVAAVFKEKFISKWLFDVEIFHRLMALFGKQEMHKICKEEPLKSWVDTDDSRLKMTYFFKLWFDLLSIRNRYKAALK
ncbi:MULTISPECIES: glycosyltransferase [unclassified Polaribacter]|uniref:glycosyltransferase n=1 Tax=unclassified Polaribacter TaxID=196858 RepID=UPI0011BFC0FA|nr:MULTISPECIES: glycosyltransferase [unclassified Polaribacter]TXD51485.1 glycosyltransferase [Polaribacter sp. IC063]TXD61787.1 glycosyltransferase [Polaribacter sp. IC066]